MYLFIYASSYFSSSPLAASPGETFLIRDPRDSGREGDPGNLGAFPHPDEKHEIPLRTYTPTSRRAFSAEDGRTSGSGAVKSFLVALGTRSGDTSPVRAVYIETVVG